MSTTASSRRHPGTAVVAAALAGYGCLQWLGRTYGSTPAERRRSLPGDELCRDPRAVTTHAITIDAPTERVWPWLVQMGWGRGQWYTARWVDRLFFPANGPSANVLHPEWQELAVGDQVLDGPPEARCAFVVADVQPGRHLVLRSREHLPAEWEARYGAGIDFTWAFVLDDLGDGRTRFVFRSRFRAWPPWVAALYLALIVPADFVMARQMLHGVKSRAEGTTAKVLSGLPQPVAVPGGVIPTAEDDASRSEASVGEYSADLALPLTGLTEPP